MNQPADNRLLEMRGISKSFPGVQALEGVDFTVRRGEIHALMGENGAGKSTLIKVLTGVYRRDGGRAHLGGAAIHSHSPMDAERLGISTVYQEVNLIPHLSVAENICLGRQSTRFGMIRWRAIRRRAEAAVRRLGFAIDVSKELASYSIAIQQMTAIARALDVDARLLILDEPTSSLDENEVEELFTVMRRLRDQGLGIIFITHFIDQVYAVSDRVTVLRNGRLVGEYRTEELPRIELIARMIGKDAEEVAALDRAGQAPAPAPTGEAFVGVEGLGRRGAIAPMDMTIQHGQVVGLAGLLGSGRTETARLLFGIDKPDTGRYLVDGRLFELYWGPVRRLQFLLSRWCAAHLPSFLAGAVKFLLALEWPSRIRLAIRLGFAFTPEDRRAAGIIPHLSVRENIVLAMQASRGAWRTLRRGKQRELAERFIEALDIKTPGPEQALENISGGNQQKVLLARWLATEPRLLILDEPTRGIDVGAKAEIEKLIASLRADGMAILFISSELEEVVRGSQRVVVLRDRAKVGELVGDQISEQAIMRIIARHEDGDQDRS